MSNNQLTTMPTNGTTNMNLAFMEPQVMLQMTELAKVMASAAISVPKHFQNNPGDCLALIMQATQWGMNPFAVAQKTFLLKGVLGYEAQLVSAVINANAPIQGRLEYEYFGKWENIIGNTIEKPTKDGGTYRALGSKPADEKGVGVIVKAKLRGESNYRELRLELAQVITRNSTLWAEDPKQQLSYLATKKWARLFCPDVILGVYTPDEVEQINDTKAKKYLNKDTEDAVAQLGLSISKQNGFGVVVGKSFGKDSILKSLGFEYLDNGWMMELEPIDVDISPIDTPDQTPKEEPKPKPNPAKQLFGHLSQKLSKEQIGDFVSNVLGLTKDDEQGIVEVLEDITLLDKMVEDYLQPQSTGEAVQESLFGGE